MELFFSNYVNSGTTQIWTEAFGNIEDPAILLISGAGSSARFWDNYFCKILSEKGFFVIRYDLRDVGLSTSFDKEIVSYDLHDLAVDILAILGFYSIDKAHLIGHAMGGFIAQEFATNFPYKTITLTIIASSPIQHTPILNKPLTSEEKNIFDKTLEVMNDNLPNVSFEQSLENYLNVWEYLNGKVPFDKDIAYHYTKDMYNRSFNKVGVHTNHLAIVKQVQQMAKTNHENLNELKVPTLIIQGDEDYLVLPRIGGFALAEVLPHSELKIIPKMGHMFFNKDIMHKLCDLILEHSTLR
ncbi:3-oxoadipate enol-lactonase 2 [Candidatus Rubidus massiliensis]|nr:3-oxoadipate enol-lactonase 2 [Candidatus Rubidus massiliensis]